MKSIGLKMIAAGIWMMLMTALITGCGGGFTKSPVLLTDGQTQLGTPDQGGNGGGVMPPTFDASKYHGVMAAGGVFKSAKLIDIDVPNKKIEFRLPLLPSPYLNGAVVEFPVPDVPGAVLKLVSEADGSMYLAFSMPIDTYLKGIELGNPSKLPNGDPLPGVPDGELPSTAITLTNIKDIKATIYMAPTVLGIFVNTPFDPILKLTIPIRNKAQQVLGYFSVVPARPAVPPATVGAEGGFFVSFKLPDDLARELNDLF